MNESPTLASEINQNVVQRMEGSGMASFAEYLELVDDVIEEFIENGRMTEEEDSKALRETLERMYSESEETSDDLLDDGNNDA